VGLAVATRGMGSTAAVLATAALADTAVALHVPLGAPLGLRPVIAGMAIVGTVPVRHSGCAR
jgi:hypothetical protein